MRNEAAPIPLTVTEESGSSGGSRIRRILGGPVRGEHVSALVTRWETPDDTSWRAAWVDATRETPTQTARGSTACHILWTGSPDPHRILAGVDEVDAPALTPWAVAPGDTMLIPAGVPYRIGAGVIACTLESGPVPTTLRPAVSIVPPTHGLPVFHRYNRRTICIATPDLVLERWKLTQPLDLPLDAGRWHYLANLVAPVALSWPGGFELLGRTVARLLPPGLAGITLVPGDLGYVLLAYVPNLERDVIAPLRGAGYDADAITALGVPNDLLQALPEP